MLGKGANPNVQNSDGNTPLHLWDTPDVITALLKHGAKSDVTNKVA